MKITATSPAKIHLIGEYSAVWNKPAILLPINLHLSVILSPHLVIPTSHTVIPAKAGIQKKILNQVQNDKEEFQLAIEKAIESKFRKKIPSYSLKISSNIPIRSGLGSSAALSASLTKALLSMLKIKASDQDIFNIAIQGEKIFHGFPSGSDLWTVIINKPLWYRKEINALILIQPLEVKIPQLFLINSGKPAETTKQMVKTVNDKPKSTLKKFADSQEELTRQMFEVLNDFEPKKFTQIIKTAHKNLVTLGVVSKKTQNIIHKIEKAGGAAKITGAGGRKKGSGMLIAYHKDIKKLLSLAKENAWDLTIIHHS